MAATVIDAFKIVWGADTSKVEQGMQHVQNVLQGGLHNIMTNFIAPLTSAFAATALFNDYTAKADAIGKMSAAFDLDGEKLQAWGEAAVRAGGSAEGLQGSVRSLNMSIQQFAKTGKGRAATFLEMMGIKQGDLKNADGTLKDAFEVLQGLADKAETMGKSEFAGFAARLGLDQGTIMLLQSGRKAVDELVERQKSLGVYTQKDFEVTANFNDAIADLGQVFKSVAAIVFRAVTPVVTKIAGWLTDGMMFLRRHEPFIKAVFVGIAASMTMSILPALSAVTKAFLASGTKIMLSPWGLLAGLILGIALAVDDLLAYLDGGESELADFWAQFGSAERLKETLRIIGDSFSKVFDSLISAGKFLKQIFSSLFDTLIFAVKVVMTLITTTAQGILNFGNWASNVFKNISNAISWTNLMRGINVLLQFAREKFSDFLKYVNKIADNIGSSLSETWNGISSALSDMWNSIIDTFSTAGANLAAFARDLWRGITAPVRDKLTEIKVWFKEIFADIGASIGGALDWILGIFGSTFDGIGAIAETVINWLSSAFADAVNFVGSIFSGLSDIVSGVGAILSDIWSGICNFFINAWDGAIGWIKDKLFGFIDSAKSAWSSVKSFFGFGDDEPEPEPVPIGSRGNNNRIDLTTPDNLHTAPLKAETPQPRIEAPQMTRRREMGEYIPPPPRVDMSAQTVPRGDINVLPPVYQPAQAVSPSKVENRTNVNNDTQINVSNIEVQTQATDAQGIAAGIGGAMTSEFRSRDFVVTANSGVVK